MHIFQILCLMKLKLQSLLHLHVALNGQVIYSLVVMFRNNETFGWSQGLGIDRFGLNIKIRDP